MKTESDINDIVAALQLLMGDMGDATKVSILRQAFGDGLYVIARKGSYMEGIARSADNALVSTKTIIEVVGDDQGIGKLAMQQIREHTKIIYNELTRIVVQIK